MPAPIDAFQPGDVFRGHFIVTAKLGEGLHGEVYAVEHQHTGERFALKVLRLEDTMDAGKVQRSMRTAKATYWIRHRNVVTVHDLGCEDDGKVWILMELLEGTSVGALLARHKRLSLPLAFHVVIDAAWAVDAAHEQQILHRDLKPDNLWLTREGVVKVLDWGLAKVIPEGVQTTRRLNGIAVGTAPWMAPESFKGGDPDARADIYALGTILYQCLAGRHFFEDALRNTEEMVRRQIFVEPEPLSTAAGLPAYVDDFARTVLAKDPARRLISAAAMARATMTLRDRLRADAEAGLVRMDPIDGEPLLSGDPWARREYQPPRPLPETEAPESAPSARVVVPTSGTGPKGTLLLPGPVAPPTLQGTLPIGDGQIAAARAALPFRPATARGTPETPPAVERRPGPATARPRLAAFAALSAVIASIAVVLWLRERPSPPAPSAVPIATAGASPTPAEPSPPPPPASAAPPSAQVAPQSQARSAPPLRAKSKSAPPFAPPPEAPLPEPAASARLYSPLPPVSAVAPPQPGTPAQHRVFGVED